MPQFVTFCIYFTHAVGVDTARLGFLPLAMTGCLLLSMSSQFDSWTAPLLCSHCPPTNDITDRWGGGARQPQAVICSMCLEAVSHAVVLVFVCVCFVALCVFLMTISFYLRIKSDFSEKGGDNKCWNEWSHKGWRFHRGSCHLMDRNVNCQHCDLFLVFCTTQMFSIQSLFFFLIFFSSVRLPHCVWVLHKSNKAARLEDYSLTFCVSACIFMVLNSQVTDLCG